jgi:hypothetical protein
MGTADITSKFQAECAIQNEIKELSGFSMSGEARL